MFEVIVVAAAMGMVIALAVIVGWESIRELWRR